MLNFLQELIIRNYYWLTLHQDIEAYVKDCNICLASKATWHKLYGNLQALLVPTHRRKDLFMDFVPGLLILIDWKSKSYDLILVIVDKLPKIVYYKSVKIMIDAPGFEKVIINVMVWYYGLSNSIIADQGSLYILKFWSLLCYFLEIKRKRFTAFHLQIDS